MLDYETMMAMAPVVMEQSYSGKDSCLYALAVGCGVELDDDWVYPYLSPVPPERTLAGLASVLAAPRVATMGLGITLAGVLHGSQGLVSHLPLPPEGRVRSETRIVEVYDRGEGRGSQVDMVRDVLDAESGVHYASLEMSFLCRYDQVAGARPLVKVPPFAADRAPDATIAMPTSTQSAQLFSLTGDQNPLHLRPAVAVKAGFPAAILHGMATYGVCAVAAEKALCREGGNWAGQRLKSISGKFVAPVFPGETIELVLWYEESGARIEARIPARDKVVFGDGRVTVEKVG